MIVDCLTRSEFKSHWIVFLLETKSHLNIVQWETNREFSFLWPIGLVAIWRFGCSEFQSQISGSIENQERWIMVFCIQQAVDINSCACSPRAAGYVDDLPQPSEWELSHLEIELLYQSLDLEILWRYLIYPIWSRGTAVPHLCGLQHRCLTFFWTFWNICSKTRDHTSRKMCRPLEMVRETVRRMRTV